MVRERNRKMFHDLFSKETQNPFWDSFGFFLETHPSIRIAFSKNHITLPFENNGVSSQASKIWYFWWSFRDLFEHGGMDRGEESELDRELENFSGLSTKTEKDSTKSGLSPWRGGETWGYGWPLELCRLGIWFYCVQKKGRTICYYVCCLSLYRMVSRQNVILEDLSFLQFGTFPLHFCLITLNRSLLWIIQVSSIVSCFNSWW